MLLLRLAEKFRSGMCTGICYRVQQGQERVKLKNVHQWLTLLQLFDRNRSLQIQSLVSARGGNNPLI